MPQLSDWQPLFNGVSSVQYANGTCGQTPDGKPNVNALQIDLTAPGIALRLSGWDDLQTDGLTVRDFLNNNFDSNTMQAMIAVNANYFDNNSPYVNRNIIFGIAVSEGQLLTPIYGTDGPQFPLYSPCALVVSRTNIPTIVNIVANDPEGQAEANAIRNIAVAAQGQQPWTATSGNVYLVSAGVPFPGIPGSGLAARTMVGLSEPEADGTIQYLYLVTIDGLENSTTYPTYGATYTQAADWLVAAGANEGFNLDGGGSTTMAKIEAPSDAVLMNEPHDNEQSKNIAERAVGVSFGVVVLT